MVIQQHLIDPETCIQCDTCEQTCPVKAISHELGNYVVDPAICNSCKECIAPCPTGAIDHWRMVPQAKAYSVEVQSSWSALPEELSPKELESETEAVQVPLVESVEVKSEPVQEKVSSYSSVIPPWSAAHPYTNLYRADNPVIAKVTGNMRVTEKDKEYDTHQIVLDLGTIPFPILEGQSVGVIPKGLDDKGKPHKARQYSVSSARSGEREGYNNLALTVKRVLKDRDGKDVYGVASNYLCDLKVGEEVRLTGPYGSSFLMPNHPGSHLVMICTGTGSAPMRAMLIQRNRQLEKGGFKNGKLMLFFGARTPEELPFFGRLHRLPKDLVDVNLAFSRLPDKPKQYVQDLIMERKAEIAKLLADPDSYFYICGLRSMEDGVVKVLREIAEENKMSWETLGKKLKEEGRLHMETY